MFYVFILESIGTAELVLIGLVALIVFGPRKLPELARTVAKTIAEFRRSSDEFKNTWKQELDLEGAKKSLEKFTDLSEEKNTKNDNSISRKMSFDETEIVESSVPEIREISESDFNDNFAGEKYQKPEETDASSKVTEKRDWL